MQQIQFLGPLQISGRRLGGKKDQYFINEVAIEQFVKADFKGNITDSQFISLLPFCVAPMVLFIMGIVF